MKEWAFAHPYMTFFLIVFLICGMVSIFASIAEIFGGRVTVHKHYYEKDERE